MANYVLDHTGQQVNTKLTKAENIDNKVTSLSSNSTNTQYPSAKLTYDQLALKQEKKPNGTALLIDNSTGKINTTYIPDSLLGALVFGGIITSIGGPSGTALYLTAALTDSAKSILGISNDTCALYPSTDSTSSNIHADDCNNMFFILGVGSNTTFDGLEFNNGDWLIAVNDTWKKIDNTDSVASVNGKVGSVVLKTSDLTNDSGFLPYKYIGSDYDTLATDTGVAYGVVVDNKNGILYNLEQNRQVLLRQDGVLYRSKADAMSWNELDFLDAYENRILSAVGTEQLQRNMALAGKADKATTLSGYGITDAKIEDQTITLGSNNREIDKKTTLVAWDTSLGSPGDGGWRRLGYFSTLSKNSETSYSLGEMYITGMYLDHFTTVAMVEFVTQSSNVDLKQISGVLNPTQNGNTISRVRLVNKASGQWYLDVYIPSLATDKRIGTQYIILKGYYNFTSDTSNNTNNFLSSTIENAITNKKVCNLRDMSGDLHETHISLLRTAATSTQLSGSTHWKRVCILKNISGEASPVGQIYLTGTYNSSQPTIAIFDFACYYNTASISQVYGLKNLNNAQAIDKIRLVYKSSTEWYLDIHSKTNLVGNVSIGIIGYFEATNIVDPNDNTFLTSEPASGIFIAECTIQNENGSIADRLSTPLTPADLDLGNAKIYYGTCSTAAATTQKDVVCATYPRTGDPVKGDIIFVTFDNTNSAAVADLTLKIGNSTAKHIVYQNTTSIGDLPAAEYLIANNTYRFQYDGTNWIVILNYNTNTNTQTRIYKENTNGERPLIASRTAASSITSGSTAVYGIIPGTAANIPTMNPSTGKLTVPGGIQIGTLSTSSSAYTTTIYGTADIDRLEIQGDIIPINEGCKLGDEGWEWDTIYSNNYIGSAELTGTPTAPTAVAGTNTTQIATTAFVQTAIKPKVRIITLTASSWSNSDPYSQTVTISNYTVTANTKVDLCFDPTVYAQMLADGCSTIYIVNNNGTLTAYAQGAKLTANLSVQCRVEEVTTL